MKRTTLICLLGMIISFTQGQSWIKAKFMEGKDGNLSDTTIIINKGDTLLHISEDFGSDSVYINTKRFNVTVGSNGVSILKKDSLDHKTVVTRFLLLDIGFAGILEDRSFNLSPENEFLDLRYGKSRSVNLQLFTQRVRFAEHHMNFSYGLMFEFHKYRLINDIQLVASQSPLTYVESETDYRKNKLKAAYLNLPIMLGYESKPDKIGKSFRIRAGIYGGILTSSKQKLVAEITEREKIHDDFNLSRFHYGVRGEIGYGYINFYVHYDINEMFKSNQGPVLHPINFGIMLLPF